MTGSLRPLWVMLGVLLVLTPLGLLAAGTAWGEWGAADFSDPAARQEMTKASLGQAPPAAAPRGLERLSSAWTAPLPDYAPPFLRSAAVGYLLSGMFGAGLVILAVTAIGALARLRGRRRSGRRDGGRVSRPPAHAADSSSAASTGCSTRWNARRPPTRRRPPRAGCSGSTRA